LGVEAKVKAEVKAEVEKRREMGEERGQIFLGVFATTLRRVEAEDRWEKREVRFFGVFAKG
jgi:hypothetical protein